MTDRLLNELIDVQARQLGWSRWKVAAEREVAFFEIAGAIVGGISGFNLPLPKVTGPAIIVVPSISIHIQHTSSAEAVYGGVNVTFYRNANKNDVLVRSIDFKISFITNNGAAYHYRADLNTPLVFANPTTAQIGIDSSTAFAILNGWGRAIIINKY